MKLYKEAGTNPFASCLPILLQMPIFFALFRLLDQAAKGNPHGCPDRGAGRAASATPSSSACRSRRRSSNADGDRGCR